MFSNALPGVSTRLSDDKTNEEQTSLNEGSIPKIKPEELEAGADEPADDSDSELEENGVTRPQHVTERRRVQNTIFSSWCASLLTCKLLLTIYWQAITTSREGYERRSESGHTECRR